MAMSCSIGDVPCLSVGGEQLVSLSLADAEPDTVRLETRLAKMLPRAISRLRHKGDVREFVGAPRAMLGHVLGRAPILRRVFDGAYCVHAQ